MDAGQSKLLHEDVQQISKSFTFVLAALSDIHRAIVQAKRNKFVKRPANGTGDFSKKFFDQQIVNFENLDKTKLSGSIKKIEYYLALVAKYKDSVFSECGKSNVL